MYNVRALRALKMGRNSLGKILNDFETNNPAQNNYMFIDYKTMSKRDLLAEYIEEYTDNMAKVEKCMEINMIKLENHAIKGKIRNLYRDTLYPEYVEVEKLEKLLKVVPSVPSGLKDMKSPEDMTEEELARYYDIEIFKDCIMFNISPNWKGETSSMEHRCRIEFLKLVIDKFYKDCNWFTKHKYVIECGKDANHTHAHCVFELNPKMKKQVATWLKSNVWRDFRNIWKKINEGIEGDYEGMVDSVHALQKIILRTRILRDDKLEYLIEENKPFSHQNKEHDLYPVLGGNWDE